VPAKPPRAITAEATPSARASSRASGIVNHSGAGPPGGWADTGPPGSRAHECSVHALVLWPRGAHQQLAIALLAVLPSASVDSVGTPNSVITRLNSPACTCPSRRFAGALTNNDARFRVVADRYPST
jgi:hypothetical protein